MGRAIRWMFRIATALVALVAVAVAVVAYLAARSLPDYDKTRTVAGLSAPVEIVRDTSNVPHILGEADADVFFGLGYAHAQDRLWQMVVLRRTAQGRLSEMFGRRTLEVDTLMRRFGLYRAAQASVDAQDDRTRAALEAYAEGVNARLAEINDESLGRGAPEFFIFDAPIAPWRPADSLALVKVMALQLSGHLSAEVRRARLSLALEERPGAVSDLLPDAPGAGVAALPEYAALLPERPERRQVAAAAHDPLWPLPEPGFAGASNAWAAAPARAAAGGTLLANDPHLGLSAPAIWYLARLELSAGGVIGATIPGIPAVLSGRSDRLGWGLTSSYLDDQDVLLEEVNPDAPEEYRTPDGWAPFETRRSIVEIEGEAPVTLTLRHTENGPVLPRRRFGLEAVTPPGHVAAVSWTALSEEDTSLGAAIGLMYADTVEEALDAAADYVAPSQMLTVVDGERIALKLIGAMPRRDAEHQTQGRMPAFGYRPENRWKGTLPYESNPGFVDPRGGIVGNTNNKIVDRPFPFHVSHRWGDTQRVERWRRLMQGREIHTRDSFVEAQLDTVSYTARTLLPLVGADLWFTGEAAPAGTPERRRQRALELLAEWNGEMNEHRPEPLIYAAWMRALQERLIRDDLGPLAEEFPHVEPLFIERVFRDVDGAAGWCDIRRSSADESCSDIARLALDDALVWIGERYGDDLESLRWGDAHQATHDHQALGEVPVLRYFVNIRQSTSGGDNTLMRGLTRGEGPDPFENVHAAGYRGVYDFADPDSSLFVISTGQSGHFLSRHYDDLGQLWRRGEYVRMSLDAELARAGAVGVTRLVPEGS
ncbi:penicillin acylase family protein [Rhodosalinus sp.]|uniref:penicillin acylase family protein n=1 Tax=Rhodosalinus sp. TaxID=2047741 RepID=UPI0035649F98